VAAWRILFRSAGLNLVFFLFLVSADSGQQQLSFCISPPPLLFPNILSRSKPWMFLRFFFPSPQVPGAVTGGLRLDDNGEGESPDSVPSGAKTVFSPPFSPIVDLLFETVDSTEEEEEEVERRDSDPATCPMEFVC